MLFTEPAFLFVFLPLCIISQLLIKKILPRNIMLLIMSLIFYAWGEPVLVLLMVGISLLSWLTTKLMHSKNNSKFFLFLSVTVTLLPLIIFKYSKLIVQTLNFIPVINLPVPEIALPIGISFYTFQILTYTIDVYRGNASVQSNPLNFMLYISLFPQLIAGPIVRYTEVEKQLTERSITPEMFTEGVYRFVIGLGKKVLIANVAGKVVTDVFTCPLNELSTVAAWGAMLCYTFQIYFDFSGYSDMAIGLGKIFGFTYNENFNYPYISTSIKEFWRRWHISMNTFFRDYVYIPLGGNRKHQLLNMFIVWALTGLWHGAGYNFILWGLYFFVLLSIEKIVYKKFTLPKFISLPLTFILVLIGWVFFYFEDMGQCLLMLKLMFTGNHYDTLTIMSTNIVVSAFPALIVCAVFSTPLLARLKDKLSAKLNDTAKTWIMAIFVVVMLVVCTSSVISSSYNPFLYFKF